MAHADLLPRGRTIPEFLRRLAQAIHPRPSVEIADYTSEAEDCADIELDPATHYDIGTCPAYRDYRSASTAHVDVHASLSALAGGARWNAMR